MGRLSLGNSDEDGLLAALRLDRGNSAYHYLLARYYQMNLISPDIGKAIGHYRESIRNKSSSGKCLDRPCEGLPDKRADS